MSLHGPSRPVRAARSILDRFGIRDPEDIDLELIAGERRTLIEQKPMEMAEGRLVYRDGRGTIAVNRNIALPTKRRFVIAHEIGHIELHPGTENVAVCDEEALSDYREKQPRETEANEFAGELLMPRSMFEGICDGEPPHAELLETLATTFRTSLTASAIRYARTGPYASAVILTKDGLVRWFWPGADFPYQYLEYNVAPPSQSGTGKVLRTGESLDEPEVITAPTWFGSKAQPDQYFNESTHYSEKYNQIISVLWEYDLDLNGM